MKIHGFRYQLIGDSIGALPVLIAMEKKYPGSFKSWGLAKKVSHAAPLFLNHPLINQIFIFDGAEGPESERDFKFINSHDLIINGNPQHPFEHDWPNYRSFYEETFVMAGIPLFVYEQLSEEEKYPKLYKWFNIPDKNLLLPSRAKPKERAVALWPFAGYGKEPRRTPNVEWYNELLRKLIDINIHVFIFGHPNDRQLYDYDLSEGSNCNFYLHYKSHEAFFEQIKQTLACDLVLSTDSGSGLIFAAYGHNQINFITNHWPNHKRNPLALAPKGPNTHNFFGDGSANSIDINDVLDTIQKKLC